MAWSLSWTSRRQFPQGYIGGALGFCGLKTILCPGGYSFSEDNDKGFGLPGGGPRLIIPPPMGIPCGGADMGPIGTPEDTGGTLPCVEP